MFNGLQCTSTRFQGSAAEPVGRAIDQTKIGPISLVINSCNSWSKPAACRVSPSVARLSIPNELHQALPSQECHIKMLQPASEPKNLIAKADIREGDGRLPTTEVVVALQRQFHNTKACSKLFTGRSGDFDGLRIAQVESDPVGNPPFQHRQAGAGVDQSPRFNKRRWAFDDDWHNRFGNHPLTLIWENERHDRSVPKGCVRVSTTPWQAMLGGASIHHHPLVVAFAIQNDRARVDSKSLDFPD